MEAQLLEEIGLTKGEIAVYFSLLELGSSTVGPIINKAKVSSSKVYDILERLIDKGLVSYVIKENKKYFEAAEPKRILDYIKEKKERLNKQEQEIEKILPELELKQKLAELKSEAHVFKGNKGFKTAFRDILNTLKKGEKLSIMGIFDFDPEFKRMIVNFHRERSNAGINADILLNNDAKSVGEELAKLPITNIKYMENNIATPGVFLIYGNKTLISLPNERTFFRIENKEATTSFRAYFNTLWNQDTYVSKGFNAFENAWTSQFNKLKQGESYNVFGAAFGTIENEKEFTKYFQSLHKKRISKGIKSKILFQQGAEEVLKKFKIDELYSKNLEFKMLPFKSEFPVEIYPQGDTTLLLIQKKEPTIITIKNKEVTQSFINFFEALWNQS